MASQQQWLILKLIKATLFLQEQVLIHGTKI
jgi:hypothetical protein